MKKVMLLLASVMTSGTVLGDDDIIENVKELNEVVVKGVKAQKDAPFAVTEVTKEKLETFAQTGQELPVLFSKTPGVMSWSENGLGTGTVYMRIRGAADSRINVTLDGVPLNSPEDQCVFWANMNSYSALLGNAQIQRGVGTSTNGDGAFGGTISLTSKAPNTNRSLELNASYGSYNTYNLGGSFSTGLIGKHFIFDGAYHETNTDGYIDGTGGRSGSYYGGLSWLDDKFIIRYKNFGN
ncbi:MAG: TonB-dependent receptor plug domain-containing protein, partial [Bacteroidales bacterium]|nr:TonB-dependent receptor plug domain-containing protein [Bacteroidales bacterium]